MALRDVAVVGVAPTKQARRLKDVTEFDLVLTALDEALADAGLVRADVDGVALEWPGPGGIPGKGPFEAGDPSSWARVLGHDLAWVSDGMLDTAGAKGVLKAAAAVSAGLCDVAVVGGAQSGAFSGAVDVPVRLEFTDVWGAYVVPVFGLVAARHMHEFGTTSEQLAAVAVSIRNLGYRNPEAVMFGKDPITVDDVLASRMIASPFHLLDLCVNAEGGGVLVLTSTERARDLRQPVVSILGGGMQFHEAPYKNPPLYREVGRMGAAAAERAFRMAGIGPSDLDVMALYDPNTFEVIRQLEVLGICKEGEGGPYVESVGIGLDSPLPVNTDGGLLSYAWNGTQHMTLRVAEVVRQLRGAAVHQVPDAEVGLAANAGSGASHQELLILGRG
ncbi:MAG TPA: thiolase family protein [Pseudonocardia sp.]|jgi:acetyl-CoA acetyltransferase|nr:thiolase family protein [Pseudonocardia sp.]